MANNKSTFQGVLRDARLNASIVAHIEHQASGDPATSTPTHHLSAKRLKKKQQQTAPPPPTVNFEPVCELHAACCLFASCQLPVCLLVSPVASRLLQVLLLPLPLMLLLLLLQCLPDF